MIKNYWCDGPYCGVLAVVDGKPLHPYGCQGKPIPIATLCSEPTVIDESDLAPGMVCVAVDDYFPHRDAWLCTADAFIGVDMFGAVLATRMHYLDTAHLDARIVRQIAGHR